MKIVILDGMHRKDGMTAALVSAFLAGAREKCPDLQVETFDLLNADISFCLGCGKCTESKDSLNAPCALSDDMDHIRSAALAADVLVFATPIYEYCVSSAMKRFLERCLTLVTFRFGPAPRAKPIPGKQGVAICSSGAPFPFNHLMGITRYPRFMLRLAARLFRCERVELLMAGGMSFSEKAKRKQGERAEGLGSKLASRFCK